MRDTAAEIAGNSWPLPGMEQQRFVGIDEKLVEGEARRARDARDQRREPINPVRDFINLGFHPVAPPTKLSVQQFPQRQRQNSAMFNQFDIIGRVDPRERLEFYDFAIELPRTVSFCPRFKPPPVPRW